MFKIGYRAIYQQDIVTAIKEAKNSGFTVLEIHLSSPQFLPANYSVKELKAIRDFAKQQGIVLQLHAPLELSLIFVSPGLRAGAKKQIKEMIRFGLNIGARCLTLHPGSAAIYHTAEGKKMKGDNIYTKFYVKLLADSIKYTISIAPKNLFICLENTDNFITEYQKVLDKYLPSGRIFLTWDIRKNYSYTTNELIKEQWKFIVKNKKYVQNLHVSGFNAVHGNLDGWADKLDRFFELFGKTDLPMIVEILPLEQAIQAKDIINELKGERL